MSQCRGTTVLGVQCRHSGAFVTWRGYCSLHAPKFYLTHQSQIDRARAMFDWWWRVGDTPYSPRWENCDPEIQAYWMDGAWTVSQCV